MIKAWSDAAWEDFEYWMKQDKKTLKRILQLLKDIPKDINSSINAFFVLFWISLFRCFLIATPLPVPVLNSVAKFQKKCLKFA